MYMCKQGEGKSGSAFVRMVNAAPYPMMVMAPDYSLDDIVRFFTLPHGFSILGIDPTFNLGEFDATVTTYRHLLLQHHTHSPPHWNCELQQYSYLLVGGCDPRSRMRN